MESKKMKELNNYLSIIGLGWLFKVSVIISSLLLIAGFFVPPGDKLMTYSAS